MKSLNQIIAELEDFATAHWQIHTFGHGDVWEISPQSSGIVYPVLWMVPQAATPTLNEVVDEFTVLCMDLVDSGERNETEVLSDTRQIILDVCAYYRQTHTNSYIIEFGGSIQPFTERDPERVSGHSLTIRIKQPHDYNLCAVPANAVTVPPIPSCADATVQNTASNPTYQASVASGGVLVLPQLKVLDSDGVTPILANYIPNTSGFAVTCTPPTCADATITVNTAPFGTAPSGGSLNVPVVNGGDNPVGSIVAGEVVIGNNATFINATQVTDQEAEIDANIFVTLDGTQAGAWNAGIQTWEVTGGASGSVSVAVSDATPNFGDIITITATPTGLAPTSYLFFAFDGSNITFIAEQVGASLNWTVSLSGTFEIYVLATDGTVSVYGMEEVTSSAPTLCCDLIATAPVFGISTRRLSINYTGPAAIVRRSSDNANATIPYVGENMDVASLIAHVGIGNGFDVTLYNQFAVNHPTQPSAALQPSMVVGGVVQQLGGKPTLVFNGSHEMSIPSSVIGASAFIVGRSTNNSTSIGQYAIGGNNQGIGFGGSGVTGIFMFNAPSLIQTTVKDFNTHQISCRMGGATGRIRVDGSTMISGTMPNMLLNRIATRSDATNRHIGDISEVILYDAVISDPNGMLLESNQKAYFGTP